MAVQLSVAVRNARLDAIETTIGATAILRIRTGAAPADCATADSGTVLATITCPSDWAAAAASGAKAKSGTWSDSSADATGTPGHWRLYDSGGTVCGAQGTAAVGSGDLNFDGTITAGQAVTISTFTLTDGNA